MTRNLSIFNQLRPVTVGFDDIFDHFERMFDGDVMNIPQVNYPPYNIVKTGENTYDIELALAGFSKDDINVEYENNVLTVKSIKKADEKMNKLMELSTEVSLKECLQNLLQLLMMLK